MRLWKTMIAFVLLTALLVGIPILASATDEEIDWSQVDWTQVEWENLDWSSVDWENVDVKAMLRAIYNSYDGNISDEEFCRFWAWVEEEADISTIFLISGYTDGASAEEVSRKLHKRFKADPYYVIQTLALEDEATQERVVGCICYGFYNPVEFSQVLGAVQLPDTATDAEIAVWQAILYRAENSWGVVPSTGDEISVAIALLLTSAIGLTALVTYRKRLVTEISDK